MKQGRHPFFFTTKKALYPLPKSEETFIAHDQPRYGLGMLVGHQEKQAATHENMFSSL